MDYKQFYIPKKIFFIEKEIKKYILIPNIS